MLPPIKKRSAIVMVSGVFLFLFITYDLWEPVERAAYDFRFKLVQTLDIGKSQPSGKVVIVGIEEEAVTKEKPVLFLYPDIGNFLMKMRDYDAGAIGIDMIPIHRQEEKFKTAASSLFDGRPDRHLEPVLDLIGEHLDRSLLEPLVKVTATIPVVQAFHGSLLPFYYGQAAFMKNLYLSDIELTDGQGRHSDGIIRSQLLHINGRDSFSCSIYKLVSGNTCSLESVRLNYCLAKKIPFYRFSGVMSGKIGKDNFSGKAVILCYISGYEDMHPAPVSRILRADPMLAPEGRVHGSLIHAITAETLLTNTALEYVPQAIEIAVMTALVILCLIMTMRLKPLHAIAGTFSVIALFLACDLLLFAGGRVLRLFPQVVSPVAVLMAVYPYRYMTEERQKKKLYKTFGYYIDREVIDSLIEKGPEALLKGEYRDICILFLDIRDSTRLFSVADPEDLVKLLNLYFGRITGVIKRHGGFVNKFMGDGMLAFFASGNNPVGRAVRAAVEIDKETEAINISDDFPQFEGGWQLRSGIGIHYGRVIMGNIGSEDRMDFTIIGKNVNIASRIEGLTKEYNKTILLSESAYMMAKDIFHFEHMGDSMVKGIDRPIAVYTVKENNIEGGNNV